MGQTLMVVGPSLLDTDVLVDFVAATAERRLSATPTPPGSSCQPSSLRSWRLSTPGTTPCWRAWDQSTRRWIPIFKKSLFALDSGIS